MQRWLVATLVLCGLAYVYVDQFGFNAKTVQVGEFSVGEPENPYAGLAATYVDPAAYGVHLDYPTTVHTGDSIEVKAHIIVPPAASVDTAAIVASLVVTDEVQIAPTIEQHVVSAPDGLLVSWLVKPTLQLQHWRGLVLVKVGNTPVARDSFEVVLKRTVVETVQWWGKSALAIISVLSSVAIALRLLINKLRKPIDDKV